MLTGRLGPWPRLVAKPLPNTAITLTFGPTGPLTNFQGA